MAKQPRSCECGCGEMTKGGRFRPGHDARMHGKKHESTKIAAAMKAHAPTPSTETAYRRPKPSTGNGPVCLLNREHGRTMKIQGVQEFWCPHSDHGGNGRFYSDPEIEGQKAPDPDSPLPKAKKGNR